ncbi:MAG: SpoIID/LytB domain-containing protein, partial [Clostridiales Family XIII bacterium]|nr:SpoIID/LytB domain-containing protein [Clostridiales Family XIII bacterium]
MKFLSRLLVCIMTVCMILTLPLAGNVSESYAASVSPTEDYMIRIHLSSFGAPAEIAMNATGNHTISGIGKAVSGAFTVSADNGNIKIVSGSNTYTVGSDVTISAESISGTNLVKIGNGGSYAGDIRILNKNGTLKLVNHVDFETYVIGVLPYEMNNSWNIEALKAQAVAVRTYAYYIMKSRDRNTQEHDLVNTTAAQVYNGYNESYKNCIAAVQATSQMIMQTSNGETVYACYGASNGGFTELSATSGAASKNFAYFPYKEDPFDLKISLGSDSYSARVSIPKTISAADFTGSNAQPYRMLREKFAAAGYDLSRISGNLTVLGVALTNPRYAAPDRMFTGADIALSVPGIGDIVLSFAPYIGTNGIKRPFLNDVFALSDKARFTILILKDEGASWLLASTRYGNGTGLSQIGAYQRAIEGNTYDSILAFYYELGNTTQLIRKDWTITPGNSIAPP